MRLFITLLVIVTPLLASADNDIIICNPNGLQDELNVCASENIAVAEKELSDVYESLLKKEYADRLFVRNLKMSQVAWAAFRDADLNARFTCQEKDNEVCWGTMFYSLYTNRKATLTRERATQLRQMLRDGIGE